MAYSEQLANRVRALLAGRDDVAERPMFGGLTFMVAGHMCCGVHGDELIVRLHPDDEDAALAPARTRDGLHRPADARVRDRRPRRTEGPGAATLGRPRGRARRDAPAQAAEAKGGPDMSEVRIGDDLRLDAPIDVVCTRSKTRRRTCVGIGS